MSLLELETGAELWLTNNLLVERMANGFVLYKYTGRNRSICLAVKVVCYDEDLQKALTQAKKELTRSYDKDCHNEHGFTYYLTTLYLK